MRSVLALSLTLAVFLLIVLQQRNSAAQADLAYRVYLPLIARGGSTQPPTPTPCNQQAQVLANPSFETGWPPWITRGIPVRTNATAADGSYSVLMGGYSNAEDAIGQGAIVPSWAETAALYFFWAMTSNDTSSFLTDAMFVSVSDASANTIASMEIWNTAPRNSWFVSRVPVSNIAAYRGQLVLVGAFAFTDEVLPTTWYVDGVLLVFGCGASIASESEPSPVEGHDVPPMEPREVTQPTATAEPPAGWQASREKWQRQREQR